MTTANIDLSALSDEQLKILAHVIPEEVSAELAARNTFKTLDEGFSALAQAHMELLHEFECYRQTRTMKSVGKTGLLGIIDQLLNTARRDGADIADPVLELPGE